MAPGSTVLLWELEIVDTIVLYKAFETVVTMNLCWELALEVQYNVVNFFPNAWEQTPHSLLMSA